MEIAGYRITLKIKKKLKNNLILYLKLLFEKWKKNFDLFVVAYEYETV